MTTDLDPIDDDEDEAAEVEVCQCGHCGRSLPYDDTDAGICPECCGAIEAADEAEGAAMTAEDELAELLAAVAEKRRELRELKAAAAVAVRERDRRSS